MVKKFAKFGPGKEKGIESVWERFWRWSSGVVEASIETAQFWSGGQIWSKNGPNLALEKKKKLNQSGKGFGAGPAVRGL